ncbi:MAG: carboxypeptidase M32 [Ruminococcaceae bacterium]|nr:carboxypeptidase M32 [Oscillospiraceae bacterium]
MEHAQALEQLMQLQQKMSAFGHAMALLQFDGGTTAPAGTAANRGQTLAILSQEEYLLATGEQTVALLTELDACKDELDPKKARMVELLYKSIREMQKIPMDEYVAYSQLLVESEEVWRTAKQNNDFALFCPYLEKIFETERRFALYCAPDMDPYDYCLGKYEDGLTRQTCDEFFSVLRARLVPLIAKIGQAEQLPDDCLHGHFPAADQEALSLALMETMGIDMAHCGLATTEHPFTTSLGSHFDVRITTHYYEDNFASSMYSVIHEGGHALYDLGSDDSLAYTVLDGGVSMGIHESQSRFYENLLGRSLPYVTHVFPKICACFPEQMQGYTATDLWRAVNRVTPSLIRTEADEVTYAMHVMVRYELEKQVMSGALAVKDLPNAWNNLYREYLGIEVPSDTEGVLQDSHWSFGGIGYFPSYALGSAYGAQLLAKMRESVDVDACLARGDFAPINAWNREHIWQHGCLYKPGELLARALGEPFDPTYFTNYLESKYSELYSLT